jgi:hypothetical protein
VRTEVVLKEINLLMVSPKECFEGCGSILLEDLAVDNEGIVFVSCLAGTRPGTSLQSCIMKVSTDLKITQFLKTYCRPKGIAINQDTGEVVMSQYKNYGVSIVNRGGTSIRNMGLDAGKLPQIQLAQLVALGPNGDICVSRAFSSDMLILDKTGNIRTTFRTELGVPTGICYDRYQRILVAVWQRKLVFMLNKDGQFLQNVVTEEDGLTHTPHSVVVDQSCLLWVGDDQGNVSVYSYTQ